MSATGKSDRMGPTEVRGQIPHRVPAPLERELSAEGQGFPGRDGERDHP